VPLPLLLLTYLCYTLRALILAAGLLFKFLIPFFMFNPHRFWLALAAAAAWIALEVTRHHLKKAWGNRNAARGRCRFCAADLADLPLREHWNCPACGRLRH
jgi:hypothetical protein